MSLATGILCGIVAVLLVFGAVIVGLSKYILSGLSSRDRIDP